MTATPVSGNALSRHKLQSPDALYIPVTRLVHKSLFRASLLPIRNPSLSVFEAEAVAATAAGTPMLIPSSALSNVGGKKGWISWGCMLQTAQLSLLTALVNLHQGPGTCQFASIIFSLTPAKIASVSIQRVEYGAGRKRTWGKDVRQCFGRSTPHWQRVRVHICYRRCPLNVYISSDPVVQSFPDASPGVLSRLAAKSSRQRCTWHDICPLKFFLTASYPDGGCLRSSRRSSVIRSA